VNYLFNESDFDDESLTVEYCELISEEDLYRLMDTINNLEESD
jgi:hypothetical protein